MGRAKLGSTDVLEGAYFWRMPPDGHCPCEVVGTSVGRAKLGSTDVLGGALKDHGHGAHLAVTPSHAGTQSRHALVFTAWARATHARWPGTKLRRGWDRVEVHRGRHVKGSSGP
jgi:hypothetical protein